MWKGIDLTHIWTLLEKRDPSKCFDSLVYARGPLFPSPLWTWNKIQHTHLQDQVRSSAVRWKVLWAQSGALGRAWLCRSVPATWTGPAGLHLGRFGAGRKEPGHLSGSPEFTCILAVWLWASDLRNDYVMYLLELFKQHFESLVPNHSFPFALLLYHLFKWGVKLSDC